MFAALLTPGARAQTPAYQVSLGTGGPAIARTLPTGVFGAAGKAEWSVELDLADPAQISEALPSTNKVEASSVSLLRCTNEQNGLCLESLIAGSAGA